VGRLSRDAWGSSLRHSFLLILVAAVLVGGLAACSNKAVGLPQPEETTRSTGASPGGPFSAGPSATSGSQSNVPRSPIAAVSPCSLLSAAEVADLHAGASKEEKLNNARACRFLDAPGFVMSVGIFDDLGLDDVAANGEIKPLPVIGKHKAVQSIRGVDTCAVSIEVTKSSRVDTQGTVGGDVQKSCDLALKVAKLVEARLPQ
jgi:hypothetical protein